MTPLAVLLIALALSFTAAAVLALTFTANKLREARAIALDALDEAEAALSPPFVRYECSEARRSVRYAIAFLRDPDQAEPVREPNLNVGLGGVG